ncbi:hypothetical protein MANES_08G021550v8 [Manihot esculenta]|uniref:Uncharacterized protein n=1 Tax=Manihot esculenta TaxID=3983 RepID=A0ACB7H8Z3_MANES|nr:hypothetical protein MANES_08G021550v8 [Manihot esculenta]
MSSTPNFNFEIIHKLYVIAKHAIQLIRTQSQIFVFILIFSSNAARQPATSTATRLLPLSPNIQRYYPHLETSWVPFMYLSKVGRDTAHKPTMPK